MTKLAQLDHAHVWHPFTQMRDWLRTEPRVIVAGEAAVLRDDCGREYLDANSSIWTNLHGHAHPVLNAALERQLKQIAHSSALGLANEPASLLAAELVVAARLPGARSALRNPRLERVFFSDDGSTALEVALKLAYEFTRRTRGPKARPFFLSLAGAYHGDTVGAVSLGHIDLFHKAYGALLFRAGQVMTPFCYRCPFNRARPERADARAYRKCRWECVREVEQRFVAAKRQRQPVSAFVCEPRVQGAAGIVPQPDGWLARVAGITRAHGALLIADEVMTGFGRTGMGNFGFEIEDLESPLTHGAPSHAKAATRSSPPLFASHHEGVQPDFLCLAKGLTGGYLPMAATLTTPEVFTAFLGEYEEFKTFFHGHSYTGNQLGAAVGRASLKLLHGRASIRQRARLEALLREELATLWTLPAVGDIRQVGLVGGVELVRDWRTRAPFEPRERVGIRVCEAMAQRGVLTRPVGNVIVLMPPYCTTPAQLRRIVSALREAIAETLGE
jgi:adenosylmethionine-8-amino-7-oxononanoate aminotransferase